MMKRVSFSSCPVVGLLRLRDVLTGFLDSWLNESELKHCIVILSSVLNSDRKVSGRGHIFLHHHQSSLR